MTNWRKRMDGDKLEALLAETLVACDQLAIG
jgi:hypothetical protein